VATPSLVSKLRQSVCTHSSASRPSPSLPKRADQLPLEVFAGGLDEADPEANGSELDERFWERRALRAHIVNTEPELRGALREQVLLPRGHSSAAVAFTA
jgi:hypothetical protein